MLVPQVPDSTYEPSQVASTFVTATPVATAAQMTGGERRTRCAHWSNRSTPQAEARPGCSQSPRAVPMLICPAG